MRLKLANFVKKVQSHAYFIKQQFYKSTRFKILAMKAIGLLFQNNNNHNLRSDFIGFNPLSAAE